jgi:hypothetical protein
MSWEAESLIVPQTRERQKLTAVADTEGWLSGVFRQYGLLTRTPFADMVGDPIQALRASCIDYVLDHPHIHNEWTPSLIGTLRRLGVPHGERISRDVSEHIAAAIGILAGPEPNVVYAGSLRSATPAMQAFRRLEERKGLHQTEKKSQREGLPAHILSAETTVVHNYNRSAVLAEFGSARISANATLVAGHAYAIKRLVLNRMEGVNDNDRLRFRQTLYVVPSATGNRFDLLRTGNLRLCTQFEVDGVLPDKQSLSYWEGENVLTREQELTVRQRLNIPSVTPFGSF